MTTTGRDSNQADHFDGPAADSGEDGISRLDSAEETPEGPGPTAAPPEESDLDRCEECGTLLPLHRQGCSRFGERP